jgi:hypothetical protein
MCVSGACVRVRDLFEAFNAAAETYSNVRRCQADEFDESKINICFLTSAFDLSVDHVIVLDRVAVEPVHQIPVGFYFYGHQNNRCSVHDATPKIWEFSDDMVLFQVDAV